MFCLLEHSSLCNSDPTLEYAIFNEVLNGELQHYYTENN